jgi:hypothetical protein
MAYRRMVYEAYSIAKAVQVSCGTTPELDEALMIIEEYLSYDGDESMLEQAAELLREAAIAVKLRGCLEWSMLEQAADTLEHAA